VIADQRGMEAFSFCLDSYIPKLSNFEQSPSIPPL
jgi:hypothetical protein